MIALDLLPGRLDVARLPPDAPVPGWVRGPFTAVVRTAGELSIVSSEVPSEVRAERGFRAFAVRGRVPFSTVGLLSGLCGALAAEGVSLFAVSTFDTDWILVRSADVARAVPAFRRAGSAVYGYPHRPALLLDLLDTLVADPIHDAIPAFLGMERAAYFEAKDPSAWEAFERGQLTHAAFCARMFADRRPVDPAGLTRAICTGWDLLPGMADVLDALAGRDVHVLSNYPEWWRLVAEKNRFEGRIDRWFVSSETGVRKPDLGAYLGAASALGRDPSECVFVDDRLVNVDAAREAGMCAFVFSGAAQLVADLSRVAILTSP
ncbi:MAG: HAD-IA family hydrolase [Deltaproteobacteria bacterium]|nr:HAD-IA family hydrolase [Deltaproteobacteria bacterium]